MGVLAMNMQAFAMPFCAYMNPRAFRDDDPLNFALWCVSHVVADQKFITIFSMLFGAGIVLMTSRAEQRTGRSIWLHYRRMFWLAVFGAIHGIFIWYGDILLTYALCGCLVFWFRRRSVPFLLISACLLILIPALFMFGFENFYDQMGAEEKREMMAMWSPDSDQLAEQLADYRAGFIEQVPKRFKAWAEMFGFIFIFIWRILGVMLIGMALFKTRVLSAMRSQAFYTALLVTGFAVGLPLAAYGIYYNEAHGWTMKQSFGTGSLFNYFGSLFTALGWIGLIMLYCRKENASGLRNRFAAVGRMAFTNYIMHSIICTLVFYGHGLGFYGEAGRIAQTLLIVAIAVFQLWYSPIWLKRFRFGPLEWLWRTLAYGKRQAMSYG